MKIHFYLILAILIKSFIQVDGQEDEPDFYQCNTSLLRTYMLKGRINSSKTDNMFLCNMVKHNCCISLDLQRIYHYVNNVLPIRINEHKERLNEGIVRLRILHMDVIKAPSLLSRSGQFNNRRVFCTRIRRNLIRFNIDDLIDKFNTQMEDFYEQRMQYYDKFYCTLCDGANQKFFENHPTRGNMVTIDLGFCLSFVQINEDSIKFWMSTMLDYLRLLQHAVDCNHYTQSFNLTFYDEAVSKMAEDAMECVGTTSKMREEVCHKICQKLSLVNLMPWVDGDSNFLINTVNFFDRFFRNQEVGEFISFEMRSFYRRFETLKTLSPVQENEFMRMIIDRTNPRTFVTAPLQKLNGDIHDFRNFRNEIPRKLDNVQTPEMNRVSDDQKPTLNMQRLLQGYLNRDQVRTPEAESNSDFIKIYDLIQIEEVNSDFRYIYEPYVKLFNIQNVTVLVAKDEGDGVDMFKNTRTKFNMTETEFNRALFVFRKADKDNNPLIALLLDFNENFFNGIKNCMEAYFEISRIDYKDAPDGERKLSLLGRKKSKKMKKIKRKNTL